MEGDIRHVTFVNRRSTRFTQVQRQTSKHLRLSPTVHGNVVPAEIQATRAERAVRLDPFVQNSLDHRLQRNLQFWESISEQQAKVDAFCTIVKFALVNSQTRRS